jgi:methionyl-tRNA formyltransferase
VKVLFLGGDHSKDLYNWLISEGEDISYIEEKVDVDHVRNIKPELIVSYNYKYILKEDIINIPEKGSINLHISYLPWNRGANPNVWSILENTPSGVTIHYIDEGIDTGAILLQKKIPFNEQEETLKSSYEKLHSAIQALFRENWPRIKEGRIKPQKQTGEGTIHYVRDAGAFESFIKEKGWDTPVSELIGKLKPEGSK